MNQPVQVAEAQPMPVVARRFRARLLEGDRWGSSGYYSNQVLSEAAASRVFKAGTQVYLDHPGATENADRPERSVRDLAGKLITDAVHEADGLYADIEVYPHVAPIIEAMATDIGMSIRASAYVTPGEAEGQTGPIIERFHEATSVDFVTKAGAGGKLVALLESARNQAVIQIAEKHLAGVQEVSSERMQQKLSAAIGSGYVRDYDPDAQIVYFFRNNDHDGDKLMRQSYEYANGAVSLIGAPTEVEAVTTYVPVGESQTPHAATHAETAPVTEAGQTRKETPMAEISEAKLAELNEAAGRVPALEAERDEAVQRAEKAEAELAEAAAKVKDAANKTAAAQIVDAALDGSDLPDVALDRVREAANLLPLTEDGDLDSEALTSAIESAVKRETDYIAAITPAHKIEGFGAAAEAATNERTPVNPWARKGA